MARTKRGIKNIGLSIEQVNYIREYILNGGSLKNKDIIALLDDLNVSATLARISTIRGYGAWLVGRQDTEKASKKGEEDKALRKAADILYADKKRKRRRGNADSNKEEDTEEVKEEGSEDNSGKAIVETSLYSIWDDRYCPIDERWTKKRGQDNKAMEDRVAFYKGALTLLDEKNLTEEQQGLLDEYTKKYKYVPVSTESVIRGIIEGSNYDLRDRATVKKIFSQFKVRTVIAEITLEGRIIQLLKEYADGENIDKALSSAKAKKPKLSLWERIKLFFSV